MMARCWLLALGALPAASGTAPWWQPAVAPASPGNQRRNSRLQPSAPAHVIAAADIRQRGLGLQPTPPAEAETESEEVETPHHEEDAARLEELLQVTIAPPGYHRMPRLPKAAGRVLTPPIAVDVVVSGGALRGYFMLGARHAIESRADLAVQRYSGTSAGTAAPNPNPNSNPNPNPNPNPNQVSAAHALVQQLQQQQVVRGLG